MAKIPILGFAGFRIASSGIICRESEAREIPGCAGLRQAGSE